MTGGGRTGSVTVFLMAALMASAFNPRTVFALQTHAAPEGLYVHQGAHLFLIFSLAAFLFSLRRSRLETEKAWRLLSWGAFLLILWNAWAFAGHIAETFLPESVFIVLPGRTVPALAMQSWLEAAYYVLQMDHLLCLPALVFFCAGLRKLHAVFQENGGTKRVRS
ncbi:MAG: hypothetical protein RBR09_10400 [Desulfobulbaceae bacterium]|nr:hypothetical protein [Desulfobulbaceae bacterium]MDY0351652.1 hypothetical protein [Desulfobulbaceae bacterium]